MYYTYMGSDGYDMLVLDLLLHCLSYYHIKDDGREIKRERKRKEERELERERKRLRQRRWKKRVI